MGRDREREDYVMDNIETTICTNVCLCVHLG